MARKLSTSEIRLHDKPADAWIVIDGNVYDMSAFAPSHPGGPDLIYQYAGKDASLPYNQVHAPSLVKTSLSADCFVGTLDQESITETWINENAPESKLTVKGPGGKPSLAALVSIRDFESAAKSTFSRTAWAYVHGGSNDSITRDANLAVLRQIWLRPSIMRDVACTTTKSTLFGCELDLPLFVSPTGLARTAGQEGELALARAAGSSGIIHCISTSASYPHQEILQSTPHHAFFQLYVDKNRQNTAELLQHVIASGKVKAIFVTVDLPVVSKRDDDERAQLEEASVSSSPGQVGKATGGLASQSGSFHDSTLSWDDLAWLRTQTRLPLVIKGIQRWEDARTALEFGCQGIVVSNHGGRAADTAQPSIVTLLELHRNCPQVFQHMDVLVDGGFRRGSDIVKAICLGASAVGVGRPFMYAVSYGQEGVARAVDILRDEVITAMRLCGITNLMRDASPEFLNTASIDHLVRRGAHPYAKQNLRLGARL